MEDPIRATFSTVHGLPTVSTDAPHGLAGFFLMDCSSIRLGGSEWVFTGLLPALEEVQSGRRESVSASSELVGLEATQAGVVLADLDIESEPCVVPLGGFIDLIWRWWQHAEAVLRR